MKNSKMLSEEIEPTVKDILERKLNLEEEENMSYYKIKYWFLLMVFNIK
jgi:hypothetical protein